MVSARWIAKLGRLGWRRQLLLAEAVASLGGAAAAIRLLPFRHAVRIASRRLSQSTRSDVSRFVALASWSVEAAAARVPWRAVCFHKGLALQHMLRRRGIDARLHYGLRHDPTGELKAHVWIAADGHIVIGGNEAPGFRSVAVFP